MARRSAALAADLGVLRTHERGDTVTLIARYQLDGDDGLECLRVHDPAYLTNIFVGIAASLALVAIGLIWLLLPGPDTLPWVTVGVGGALSVAVGLQWTYLVRRLRTTWNQMEAVELAIRETGFEITERGAKSEVAWSRFVRRRESPKHFLLYKSADIYAIVPKRGFAGEADIEAFRTIAAKGIPHP